MARFGPAGLSTSFYQCGYRSSTQAPAWLHSLGLDALEYQCGHGVRISEKQARLLGEEAQKHNVALSIHAPFYISLASSDPTIMQNTRQHLLKSLQAAGWMGATRVVFHPGSGQGNRQEAMDRAIAALSEVLRLSEDMGLGDVVLAAETMGKRQQLGSLAEVLRLSALSSRVVPCVDFAHLYAVSGGALNSPEAFRDVLTRVAEQLGRAALLKLHMHFSPIEYTAGGERRHRTLLDAGFGPDFRLLAGLMVALEMEPTVICESFDRQVEDAITYRQWWQEEKEGVKCHS